MSGVLGEGAGFGGREDPDFRVGVGLLGAEVVVAEDFQDGEEDAGDLAPREVFLEEGAEGDLAFGQDALLDLLDVGGDGRVVVDDRLGGVGAVPLEHAGEGADKVPELDLFDEVVGGVIAQTRAIVGEAGVALLPFGGLVFQGLGRFAEPLVFKQLADEVGPRVFDYFDHHRGFFRLGQGGPAFDFDEGTGDDEEVAHEVEVERLKDIEELEELLGDFRDRQVEDVQFLAADQVQEQVHGAAEAVEFDAISHATCPRNVGGAHC